MYGLVVMTAICTAAGSACQLPAGNNCPCPSGTGLPECAVGKPDVILLWNGSALEAIRADRTPPPRAARNLAIVHVAMYDAVNAIARTHAPYHADVVPTMPASPVAAAAVAAHQTLSTLYPAQEHRFDAVLDDCMAQVSDGPAKTNGVALGQAVAGKILVWRAADGSTRRATYRTPLTAGFWQPTPPDFRAALLPQWPRMTCFAVRDVSRFRPGPPPLLNSPAYTAAFREVLALGAARNSARTPEQTQIAHFWADGDGTVTPPGHWNRIAQTVACGRGNTLEENARLFALLNIALADAAVCCWDCKYYYGY